MIAEIRICIIRISYVIALYGYYVIERNYRVRTPLADLRGESAFRSSYWLFNDNRSDVNDQPKSSVVFRDG